MKNFWLEKKEAKEAKKVEARKHWEEVRVASLRRKTLTRYKKKPCGCSQITVHKGPPEHLNVSKKTITVNKKFLEEAKSLENRWAKSGLLEGINNKWDRQVTAVLLEGQRLMNEQKYNLYVRTKNTGRRHGYQNIEELYQQIHTLHLDGKGKYQIGFGNGEPDFNVDMVLTITENWGSPDAKDISYDCMLNYENWAKGK